VCFIYFAREAAGALGTRLSLRPLFFWANVLGKARAQSAPRECGFTLSTVIASAAKQSILLCGLMDCFAALAMTVEVTGCLKF
jgi:hypothetical protein